MVTSSAVVGSSAISSLGSQASAMAIITRWRMPPESSCGYSSSRSRGDGDADQIEHLDAPSARAACRAQALGARRTVSMIWSPMVNTGLSEVIGSWKIIEISAPRMRRSARSDRPSRSSPVER